MLSRCFLTVPGDTCSAASDGGVGLAADEALDDLGLPVGEPQGLEVAPFGDGHLGAQQDGSRVITLGREVVEDHAPVPANHPQGFLQLQRVLAQLCPLPLDPAIHAPGQRSRGRRGPEVPVEGDQRTRCDLDQRIGQHDQLAAPVGGGLAGRAKQGPQLALIPGVVPGLDQMGTEHIEHLAVTFGEVTGHCGSTPWPPPPGGGRAG